MPKHLLLFAAFLALLTAILYHPIPDPDLWDTSQPAWATPATKLAPGNEILDLPTWTQEQKVALENTQKQESLSFIY